MRLTFSLLLGLIVINGLILYYERQGLGMGWRIYMGLVALALMAAISVPFTFALLLPITVYNLLVNTRRLTERLFKHDKNNHYTTY